MGEYMPELTEIESKINAQLKATEQIVNALVLLDVDARSLVITHACQLLSISLGVTTVQSASQITAPVTTTSTTPLGLVSTTGVITDIRTLKEQKSPKSDNEMACLVAYYLSELAPQHERKGEISKDDIEKYFKQAGFELPKALSMVLVSAKKAGYFDSSSTGTYKLNPVGFNLAAYGLPSAGGAAKKTNRGSSRKSVGQKSSKTKKTN